MTGKARSNDESFEAYQLKQNAKFENFLAQNTNIDHGQFFTSAPPQRDLRTFLNKEFGGVMGGVIGYNPSVVGIVSGAINIGRGSGKLSSHVIIQAESGTTDTLTDIQNFVFGYQDLTIQADTGDTITVSTGGTTGSDIFLGNGVTSITLNSTEQLQLRYDTIANRWATFIDTTSGGSSGVSFPITPTINILGTVTTSQDIDLSLTTAHSTSMTLGADISITFSNYPTSGTQIEWELEITQDSTGSRVITWPTEISNPPTLSTSADSIVVVVFRTNDGGTTVRVANTVTTTDSGSGADWSNNVAVADVNFATFDGINIDRLRFVSDSGVPASTSDPSIFLDSSGDMIFNVNTLHSISFKALNVEIAKFTETATGVVALDMLDHKIKNIEDIRFFDTSGLTIFAGTDPAIGYDSTNSRFIINHPTGAKVFIFENQTLGSTIFTSGSVSSNILNVGSVLQLSSSVTSPTIPGEFRSDGTDVSVFSGGAIINLSDISGSFSDDTFRIQDDTDATKQLAFEVSNILTSTTRTITMPDSDTALVLDTLSNLGTTSINASLLPDTAETYDLGSELLSWRIGHFREIEFPTTTSAPTISTNTQISVNNSGNMAFNNSVNGGGYIWYFEGVSKWSMTSTLFSGDFIILNNSLTFNDSTTDPIGNGELTRNGPVMGLQIPTFQLQAEATGTSFGELVLLKIDSDPSDAEPIYQIDFNVNDDGTTITYAQIEAGIQHITNNSGFLEFNVIAKDTANAKALTLIGSSTIVGRTFASFDARISSDLILQDVDEGTTDLKIYPGLNTMGIVVQNNLSFTVGTLGTLAMPLSIDTNDPPTISELDGLFGDHIGAHGTYGAGTGLSIYVKMNTGDWARFEVSSFVTV